MILSAWFVIGCFVVWFSYISMNEPVYRMTSKFKHAVDTGDGAEGLVCILVIFIFAMAWPSIMFYHKWKS